MTRVAAIRMLAGGVAAAVGGLFTTGRGKATRPVLRDGGMMGTAVDMSAYMELFDRHSEIRRTVTEIPGGVCTLTNRLCLTSSCSFRRTWRACRSPRPRRRGDLHEQ